MPPAARPAPNGGASAELRTSGDNAVGDAGAEDAKTQQRQRGKHQLDMASSMVGWLPPNPEVNCENNVEPMPTMTASTSTLTPDEITLPSTRSAANAVLPNRPNGISTNPAKRCQLELDKRNKELDRQDEEGQQHHDPGEQQNDNLHEILEKADVTHQPGDRVQDRATGIDPDLRHTTGLEEISSGQARTGRLQPQAGKTLEDDAGEVVPVADQISEHANEQGLLGEVAQ